MITLKLVLPLGCLVASSTARPFTNLESNTYSATTNFKGQPSCVQLIDFTSPTTVLPRCACDIFEKQGRDAFYEYCNKNGIQVSRPILDRSLDTCGVTRDGTNLYESTSCVGACGDYSSSQDESTRGGKSLSITPGSGGSGNDDLQSEIDSILDNADGERLSTAIHDVALNRGNNKSLDRVVEKEELDQIDSKALGKVQGKIPSTSTELVSDENLEDLVESLEGIAQYEELDQTVSKASGKVQGKAPGTGFELVSDDNLEDIVNSLEGVAQNEELDQTGSKAFGKVQGKVPGTGAELVSDENLEDLVKSLESVVENEGLEQTGSKAFGKVQGKVPGTGAELVSDENLEDLVRNKLDHAGSEVLVKGKGRGASIALDNDGNLKDLVENKELDQAGSDVLDKALAQDAVKDLGDAQSKICFKGTEADQGKNSQSKNAGKDSASTQGSARSKELVDGCSCKV